MKAISVLLIVLMVLPAVAEASTPDLGRSVTRPLALFEPPTLEPAEPLPQGPLGGPQVATIEALQGDVRVARAALRGGAQLRTVSTTNPGLANGLTRVNAAGVTLANGDIVQ